MVLNDGPLGFTLNGKGFPATEPIVAEEGDVIRIRYMNEGLQIHPMHLHGMPQLVVAKDGWTLPEPYYEDTVLVAPGERIDVLVDATEAGYLGLPLPRPHPRRGPGRHVRHGHRADRRGMTVTADADPLADDRSQMSRLVVRRRPTADPDRLARLLAPRQFREPEPLKPRCHHDAGNSDAMIHR